ncbi:ATP-dependent DNA helicase RecQ [hydrothermal vent metagenome]|uniref:DNA 3'-5' helicase n=1 Tax=hydrothermal vent metagenome TaxID=652676 RepID=A0A3B1B8Z5_9ZZZZ
MTKQKVEDFSPRCLSIDLEVGRKDSRIHQMAAVRGDSGKALAQGNGLADTLNKLDKFADSLAFLLGHNLIAFDIPHLKAAKPDLQILNLPAVDTLRLNPLAFPRNPYHHLVKHYQDGRLKRGQLNNPELDARLTLDLFADQRDAFIALQEQDPKLLEIWHWLTTVDDSISGLNAFFITIRQLPRPADSAAREIIEQYLKERGCVTAAREALDKLEQQSWPLAYAMAWLSVAGGNSVLPPWVRHQFPEAGILVRELRDKPCSDPDCTWCTERHNAKKELQRWFGFDAFRPEPVGDDGQPLQQAIVEAAMRGEHLLGILPTGTGKSLCYQIPALSRYDKTGALTVVISPLVALMADQVAGLEAQGISSCAALNGLLSMPERADVLDRTRLGDLGILIISPEQLRNRALRNALAQREIGAWVLDEAHCVSKWGHDFRPDYRYVGRFIKERAGEGVTPPVLCLTATAKPDVIVDICDHFRAKVGVDLKLFDGGASRTNLGFSVVPTTSGEKFAHIHMLLKEHLPEDQPGGAIVYCASRKRTEDIAEFLREKGLEAGYFHAKLQPETKKTVLEGFIRGDMRVIAATNAFGMGIDKPDVRLVIHADIPGSLENYLQEAGRAGRDQADAHCILLYSAEDIERQFSMSARSRLSLREIKAILRSLRRLDHKKQLAGEVIATSGEILAEEEEGAFERDSATDDTRVRTALLWLEESTLLTREENRVQIFPSSLRVGSVDAAGKKLVKASLTKEYRCQLLALVDSLVDADADEGISTDEMMGVSGLSSEGVRRALHDMERLGIASNDTALTAFVHLGGQRSSRKRLEEAIALERSLIEQMRQSSLEQSGLELGKGDSSVLHLRHATQRLKDDGCEGALPEKVWRLLKSLSMDGRSEDGGIGSIRVRRLDAEMVQVTLQREWSALQKTAQLRRDAAACLLISMAGGLPQGAQGNDLLAKTTFGQLLEVLENDLAIRAEAKDPQKLLDRALLWLHEQEVIRLNKGLAVFRPAMTIHLDKGRRGFLKADFGPLKTHYNEQVIQIHVMAEYAQRALEVMTDALKLAMDYFTLNQEAFIKRWMPGREKELALQTTPESWRNIVESLNNPNQQQIVNDDREQTNVLVLAGPGSGKTRVLVHRIACLVRIRRENPRGILALAYNRHTAVEIRRRLAELIGDDAKGITVLTCHALAMRLIGASFNRRVNVEQQDFKAILQQATALLAGDDLAPEEADVQREQLLAGFRWILVDEYQDIDAGQYELISALAGRTLQDKERQLSLFAVGDDDQNIYAFDGASVEFIRRFEKDYAAKPSYLVENYRSSAHIINASNLIINPAAGRMKAGHPITVNHARKKQLAGGDWKTLDPVSQGRVQLLPVGTDSLSQTVAVMAELQRLAALDPGWNWAATAVIAREWKSLWPIRSYCELHRIPVQTANEEMPSCWRLRETQQLVAWLHQRPSKLIDIPTVREWLDQQGSGIWWELLHECVEEYALESGGTELPADHFIEWLVEWGREMRQKQQGLLLLSVHRAKGLEFDHVVVLDGSWARVGRNEDRYAPRRQYYVAMTRARKTLTLACFEQGNSMLNALPDDSALLRRAPVALPAPDPALAREYRQPAQSELDIGFAGRHTSAHPIHCAINKLQPGSVLQLVKEGKSHYLHDAKGRTVGRFAKSFRPPAGMICLKAQVIAIITRYRKDTAPEYMERVKSDCWEVVLPELVFSASEDI